MAQSFSFQRNVVGTAQGLAPRVWMLLAAALACAVTAFFSDNRGIQQTSLLAGATFAALILVIYAMIGIGAWRDLRVNQSLTRLAGNDITPCFSTDLLGQITYQNAAAQRRFNSNMGATLISTLADHFASPASVMYRLQSRAANLGSAREDVITRRGHTRLSVNRIGDTRFLWRLEEFSDKSSTGRGAEALSLPMMVANKSGVVLFTNDAMRRLLGQRPKRLDRVFVDQKLNSGEEVQVTSVDGPVRAVLAEVEGAGERREIYLLPIPQRPDPAQMQTDFEHVPVALVKFSSQGSVENANLAARELLGIEPDLETRINDLFEGLGRSVSDWLSDVVAERLPASMEVLRQAGAGRDVFLQVNLRRIVEYGRPCVIAILQDATALKKLEEQFVQNQKMQAIGQLAGGVAHDFNNLLTAIAGHCDLLLLRHSPKDSEYADLMQIHQNTNRAASLVGQLLAFSRKQTLKPERVDLQEVLSELTHLLNRLMGEKLQLELVHAAELGTIRADKRQLEQVIVNLVVNARDAMTEGGTIRIETEALVLTDEYQRDRVVVPRGKYAVVRVRDTGCGIPPDQLQKIFEPFFTTKGVGEGTGLGLSTVYGIVKQSGGFIFVDSELVGGTTFHLYFPVHLETEDVLPVRTIPPKSLARKGEGVILLVEDEAPVRAFASRALRLKGYTVLEAENAEEALKTLDNADLVVDVFVTDVVMPGMDGPTWVRQALKDRPNARVVFVSGYAEECVSEGHARIPNSVFLPKPFSLTDLALTVQNQIN